MQDVLSCLMDNYITSIGKFITLDWFVMTCYGRKPRLVFLAYTWEEAEQRLGILRYAYDPRVGWNIVLAGPLDVMRLSRYKPDGIICQLYHSNKDLAEAVRAANVPTVELHNYIPEMRVPRVMVDSVAAGRAAAQHFLDRNFRSLYYVGWTHRLKQSHTHLIGFKEFAEEWGVEVQWIDLHAPGFWNQFGFKDGKGLPWTQYQEGAEALAGWLVARQEPAAVFCEDVQFAHMLIHAGSTLGIHIPEQIAVFTHVEQQHENELAGIPVSCTRHDYPAQGYRAAETLDRMMNGETVPDLQWIDPLPVEECESTDTMAAQHLPAAMALRLFRINALDYTFTLAGAAGELGVTLQTLHRWFKTYAGMTPAEFLEKRRVKHAVSLLHDPNVSVEKAARLSGFSGHRQLRHALMRKLNASPQDLRDSGK